MQPPFTLDHWKRLPEGFPAQLVDGSLVREPAPTVGHQRLVGRIYRLLVALRGEYEVSLAPQDVVIDRFNVLQPDVCVLRSPPESERHEVGIPLAVVEVLSPSTRRRDRTLKATKLLAAGVEEIWLVDPAHRTIELRTTRGAITVRGPESARSEVVPGFELVPEMLFELL